MPKIDIASAPVRTSTIYPPPYDKVTVGREKIALGNLAGLTQFGVNLTRLKPGAWSSLRHWHENEDEFVFVIDGELTLIEDGGGTVLKAGECAGFPAGARNGHHLVNTSARDATYLEFGTRAPSEYSVYSDIDLAVTRDGKDFRFTRKSTGEPYP